MTKLALALLLLAPAAHAKKKEKPMEWKGQNGGAMEEENHVVVDEAGWNRLWLTLGQDAPELDFKKYFAVAVMAGERPTGGFTVEFLEPTAKRADLQVRYRINDPDGFSTQAIAHPWKVRAFPRVKGKVFVQAMPRGTPLK